MAFIDDADLEQRCRDLVARLDLAEASSLPDLVAAVSAHLDVPIRLTPLPPDLAHQVSGCLMVGDRDVVIGYPDRADAWYQQVTVGHELGHLLCGHPARPGPTGQERDGGAAAALLPDLQAAQEAWRLYRCTATTRIEREAELVGSLLVAALESHAGPRSPHAGRLAGLVSRRRGRQG